MDIVQETFLRIHTRIGDWRGEGELRNWIVRIAANEALNRSRSARLHPTCELDETLVFPDEPLQERAIDRRETLEALQRGMETLAPRQRLAVVLRYFQAMSAAEIGGVLGCSEGTARNLLCRSLRKLRSAMTESEESLPWTSAKSSKTRCTPSRPPIVTDSRRFWPTRATARAAARCSSSTAISQTWPRARPSRHRTTSTRCRSGCRREFGALRRRGRPASSGSRALPRPS
jgi:RNA polymerase sigma-70 factor (ECF subfamily)